MGRFKAAKGKNTSCPGKESLQRCLLGQNAGPANWPSASRLVEAICSQLCRLHPATARVGGVPKTRWSLVLTDYVAIREAVLVCPRLMAQTTIQLFELNQRTLSQWFSRRQKAWKRTVLEQGTGIVPALAVADEPLPAAKGLSLVQVGQGQPFVFPGPEEQPGPSAGGQPAPPPPPPPPPPPHQHPPAIGSAPAAAPLPGLTQLPRTTAYRKRKAAEEAAAAAAAGEGPPPRTKARRQTAQYTCSKCGQLKRLDTGHTRIAGVSYCAAVGGMTVEEWRENMRRPPEEKTDSIFFFVKIIFG
ncbi:formin-A-like [Amphiprion ocellaris]|uniref:formin-A-like n=1 Tax=Amphiprion ocellaris TaxID=80972 RepID=UPI0024118272|nr:formin-A-like [Amphiprion ocellaris]